jgi:ubiquitin C-terminal hydrolase
MDVDEFRNMLFNSLETLLPKNMFWNRLFNGQQENCIRCLECGNVSTTEETFNSICLSVQNIHTLEASLQEHNKTVILEK